MRFALIAVLLVGVAFATVSFGPIPTSGQKKGVVRSEVPVPGRYIVVLEDSKADRQLVDEEVGTKGQYLTSRYGGEIKAVFASALTGMVVEMSPEQAEEMNQDSEVRFIEEDRVISVSNNQTNAPWHLDRVDQRVLPMNSAYNYSATGSGVHIYVIDSGIRYTHSDFGGRANAVYDNIGDGQNGNDCNGHGTHVAGIAGSSTFGVAKSAYLHSVRVLPCGGIGQLSDLVAGINWVTANRQNPAVVNISITSAGMSTALENSITNSIASGITYTIAAGNSASDACGFTPARTPNALTVGATSNADARALYSNFGACIDIFAPGHEITSLSNANDTDSRVMNGTSMAAPAIAGTAALYLSLDPTASPATVADAVLSSSTSGTVADAGTLSPNLLLYTAPAAPTASTVSVSGRVTDSMGWGLPRVRITMIDDEGNSRTAYSSSFGYYQFSEIEVGRTYVISASNKRYQFAPRFVSVLDEVFEFDLISLN